MRIIGRIYILALTPACEWVWLVRTLIEVYSKRIFTFEKLKIDTCIFTIGQSGFVMENTDGARGCPEDHRAPTGTALRLAHCMKLV